MSPSRRRGGPEIFSYIFLIHFITIFFVTGTYNVLLFGCTKVDEFPPNVQAHPCYSKELRRPCLTFRHEIAEVSVAMMFQPLDFEEPRTLPRTVEEVVEILYKDLLLRDRVVMSNLSEEELGSTVYLAMAKIIRKEFGLYNGNEHLISSCQSYLGREYDSFEDPAMVIVKELWKKIRKSHNLRLVEQPA